MSVVSARATWALATPDSPSLAEVVMCTECDAYKPSVYAIVPVGSLTSETTLSRSTVAPGSRVTWIESLSGAVPSHL